MYTDSFPPTGHTFDCHQQSNPRNSDSRQAMSDSAFDLHKNYHDAIDCLLHRDGAIKELEAKLTSKDERIASLEMKLVQMSLDLASSRATLYQCRMTNLCSAILGANSVLHDGRREGPMSNRISTPINSWYKLRASTQAMSETAADAAAIPGNTGEPRQSSLFLSRSFETVDGCVLFPVTFADCLIGFKVSVRSNSDSRPSSRSRGGNTIANAKWALSRRRSSSITTQNSARCSSVSLCKNVATTIK